jgi:hypothetical protein
MNDLACLLLAGMRKSVGPRPSDNRGRLSGRADRPLRS